MLRSNPRRACVQGDRSPIPARYLTDSQKSVDEAIINIFLDNSIGGEIKLTFLDLIAFLDKEHKDLPNEVHMASAKCALTSFSGDLNESLPAIVL